MIRPLTSFFLKSLVQRRHRQGPLILAFVGLFLSSFSLIFLQSTMQGLQSKLMARSKRVLGHSVWIVPEASRQDLLATRQWLAEQKIDHVWEYEIEGLMRLRQSIVPVILHGVEGRLAYMENELRGLVLPFDLAYKLKASYGDRPEIVFPSLVDVFLEDVPRSMVLDVHDLIGTDVPDVDAIHAWAPVRLIHNVLRREEFNRMRVFAPLSPQQLESLQSLLGEQARVITWEEQHPTLVYALKLEAFMMAFLFSIMSLLVALSVVVGLLLLWNKLTFDMTSFWILGASSRDLAQTPKVLVLVMAIVPSLLGLAAGLGALWALERYGGNFMPDVFVDRNIPVIVTVQGLVLSIGIPMGMACLFGLLAWRNFMQDFRPLELVRTTGRH